METRTFDRVEHAAATSAESLLQVSRRMARHWCRSKEEAEDVAQESLLRFLRQGRQGHPVRRPDGWFFIVTRRIAGSLHYSELRRSQAEAGFDDAWHVPARAEAAAPGRLLVASIVARLPARDRRLLELSTLGASYAEIAAELGLPVRCVGKTLARARRKARRIARAAAPVPPATRRRCSRVPARPPGEPAPKPRAGPSPGSGSGGRRRNRTGSRPGQADHRRR